MPGQVVIARRALVSAAVVAAGLAALRPVTGGVLAKPAPQEPPREPETGSPLDGAAVPDAAEGSVQPESVDANPLAAAEPAPSPARGTRRAGGPVVALTFDAGADRGYAAEVLDVLAETGVPAGFGITGRWAAANPDLVLRLAEDGHLVINHTLDHRSFTGRSDRLGGLSAEQRRRQLEAADEILAALVGHSTRPWYRLPYGDGDGRVAADVAPTGYTRHAGWTVDSLGWQGLSAAAIVARCLRLAAPSAVFLLHVGRASQDGPALAALVAGLADRGFGFVRLDDLA